MGTRADPCVIVNDRDQYFGWWAATPSPRYDGDDDTWRSVPEFVSDPELAHVFSSRRSATRAQTQIWEKTAVIAYSECRTVEELRGGRSNEV